MTTEDLLIDYSSDGQAVETIREGFPQFDIVATFALVVESYRSNTEIALKVKIENQFPIGKFS